MTEFVTDPSSSQSLLQKVKKIEIKTRRLSQQLFSGEYHAAFKGKGVLFDRVREYEPGDEVRFMDWKVTAKLNHPYVKVFQEERELTLMILVDVSASSDFGTHTMLKRDMITELSAVLAFSAASNQDNTGLILYSDRIESFIPPGKGRSHTLRLIRDMVSLHPKSKGTKLQTALKYLNRVIKKRCIVFIISDFLDTDLDKDLKLYSKKFDLIGLQVYDIREKELPDLGLIHFKDTESGKMLLIDSSQKTVREAYKNRWNENEVVLKQSFMNAGADLLNIRTDESYIIPLLNFMKRRNKGNKR